MKCGSHPSWYDHIHLSIFARLYIVCASFPMEDGTKSPLLHDELDDIYTHTHTHIYIYIHTYIHNIEVHDIVMHVHYGHGFGSNRTEPLSHGLTVQFGLSRTAPIAMYIWCVNRDDWRSSGFEPKTYKFFHVSIFLFYFWPLICSFIWSALQSICQETPQSQNIEGLQLQKETETFRQREEQSFCVRETPWPRLRIRATLIL